MNTCFASYASSGSQHSCLRSLSSAAPCSGLPGWPLSLYPIFSITGEIPHKWTTGAYATQLRQAGTTCLTYQRHGLRRPVTTWAIPSAHAATLNCSHAHQQPRLTAATLTSSHAQPQPLLTSSHARLQPHSTAATLTTTSDKPLIDLPGCARATTQQLTTRHKAGCTPACHSVTHRMPTHYDMQGWLEGSSQPPVTQAEHQLATTTREVDHTVAHQHDASYYMPDRLLHDADCSSTCHDAQGRLRRSS